MINLSDKVRALCRQKKMTLKELAEQLGITETGLQRMLKTNSTRVETLLNLSKILRVRPSYFFEEDKTNEEQLKERFEMAERDFILRKRLEIIRDMVINAIQNGVSPDSFRKNSNVKERMDFVKATRIYQEAFTKCMEDLFEFEQKNAMRVGDDLELINLRVIQNRFRMLSEEIAKKASKG